MGSAQGEGRGSGRRIALLRAAMREAGLDAYLVRHVSDIQWLTAFSSVFDGEPAHLALVTSDAAYLHTDHRYSEALRIRNEDGSWHISDEVVSPSTWAIRQLATWSTRARLSESAVDTSSVPARLLHLGIEDDLPLNRFRALEEARHEQDLDCELVEMKNLVSALRSQKDTLEFSALRAAQRITDETFLHMLDVIDVGMSERAVKVELEAHMRRLGADDPAFTTIIASGENGASPHAVAGERLLQRGDLVVMDFGARYDGYCADMTRTIALGEPSEEQRRAYEAVRAANHACNAAIHPGVTCAEVHELAAQIIADAGFAGAFTHALGHGVGLDVHEEPTLSPRSEAVLEVGNVVTVEPGIYLAGRFGVRIENFGAVTRDGFESFTASGDALVIL